MVKITVQVVGKRQRTDPKLYLKFQQKLSNRFGASSSKIIWRQTHRQTHPHNVIDLVPVTPAAIPFHYEMGVKMRKRYKKEDGRKNAHLGYLNPFVESFATVPRKSERRNKTEENEREINKRN